MRVTTPSRPTNATDGPEHAPFGGPAGPVVPGTRQVRQATREAAPWIERLGRLGVATKGFAYLIVGVLAALAAIGAGGATTDQRGAFAWLLEQSFGRPLLAVVAVGLVGYALWRFVQAGLDTEAKGSDAKGLQARGAYMVSGLVYLALCFSVVQLLLGAGAESGESTTQHWTAWLFERPFGRWLVGLGGAAIVATGFVQFYRAYAAKFREKLRIDDLSPDQERWVVRLGRLGFAARGLAFTIIGGFLIAAALHANPAEARGLGGALDALAAQPFGPWLLGLTAVGLAAFGVYMFVEARYRRMLAR